MFVFRVNWACLCHAIVCCDAAYWCYNIEKYLFISILSSFLVSLGLTPQVKVRLTNYIKSLVHKQFN